MAKPKGSKGSHSVQNKHIYTRASYLYQAAQYLVSQQQTQMPNSRLVPETRNENATSDKHTSSGRANAQTNLSRQMLTDMRIVTQKILIRSSADLKRTICKFCDTLQIEGQTSTSIIENKSRGGRKAWADVLAIQCSTCGHVKRFPVSAQRQKRRPLRNEDTDTAQAEKTATMPKT
jgi:ribonuclease P protein subunit RPR2